MKRVKEIMSKTVRLAAPNDRLRDVAMAMKQDNIGMLPVSENERIIGTITDRDIVVNCVASGGDINNLTVRHAMSEGVETIYEDNSVDTVADRMADAQVRRLVVLNDHKELVGMVAVADLATHVSGDATVRGAIDGVSRG